MTDDTPDTYSAIVPESKAQALCDALNAPRSTSDDYDGPLGLGPRTVPDDAGEVVGVTGQTDNGAPQAPATHRVFTLSVPERNRERFESICDDHDVSRATWHPDADVDSDHDSPRGHREAEGLIRLEKEL